MVKIRAFRPFPKERLWEILEGGSTKMVIVLEKYHFGALFDEVRAALYGMKNGPKVMGFGLGLNGRNVEPYNIIDICEQGYRGITKRSLPQGSQLYFIRKKDEAMGGN